MDLHGRADLAIPSLSPGTKSFLLEPVDQLIQVGLMLLGLDLFAAPIDLLAKPALLAMSGLLLLFRAYLGCYCTIESEAATVSRYSIEVLGGRFILMQGLGQRAFVDIGLRRHDGLFKTITSGRTLWNIEQVVAPALEDRIAGGSLVGHGMSRVRWNVFEIFIVARIGSCHGVSHNRRQRSFRTLEKLINV